MNKEKLLKKLQSLLSQGDDARAKDIKKLHKVVKELKKKQKNFEHRLEATTDSKERSRIKKNIEVLKLQRQKGAAAYRQLKGKD